MSHQEIKIEKGIIQDWSISKEFTKDEVEFVRCPFCKSDDHKAIATERAVLGIVSCNVCGLIYVNPRLKSPEKVYCGDPKDYYEEAKFIFKGKKPHHRDSNYLDDLKIIKRFKPTGNFLDIGTNAGFFLRLAKKNKNWNIYGVEPSKSLADLAIKHFNLNIKNTLLENADFDADFFDIVTMTDVFEHIPNPDEILAKARQLMKDGGILFIKVPNGLFNLTKLRLAKLTNALKTYDIFDSYEHLIHYSHKTLSKIVEKNGFKVIYRGVSRPIQTPVWQKCVGRYYQYPTPWILDYKNYILRNAFYWFGLIEYFLRLTNAGYFSPNITVIAKKA